MNLSEMNPNGKPPAPPLVSMQALYKYHRTDQVETAALGGIDLEVAPGEFVAIMGPSGSGKSTLLNALGLVDTPSRGSYRLDGLETTSLPEKERARLRKGTIGFVFQSFNLIDELTAWENVELPLRYLKVKGRERRERVEEALAQLEMTHRKDHYPQELSGGQQQRVALARAVVIQPRLILADEPTGNLDSAHGKAVMDILQELNHRGTTIIMVTHSEHDAGYARRLVQLFDGKVLESETERMA